LRNRLLVVEEARRKKVPITPKFQTLPFETHDSKLREDDGRL
jgi:hypothetical protein